jgi:hypothetical protein
MAVKVKRRKPKRRTLPRSVRGGLSRLRKQVRGVLGEAAPPPAPNAGAHSTAGILRPDTDFLRLPESLAEAGDAGGGDGSSWLPSRPVLVITALALAFIAAIAWLISRMPA